MDGQGGCLSGSGVRLLRHKLLHQGVLMADDPLRMGRFVGTLGDPLEVEGREPDRGDRSRFPALAFQVVEVGVQRVGGPGDEVRVEVVGPLERSGVRPERAPARVPNDRVQVRLGVLELVQGREGVHVREQVADQPVRPLVLEGHLELLHGVAFELRECLGFPFAPVFGGGGVQCSPTATGCGAMGPK